MGIVLDGLEIDLVRLPLEESGIQLFKTGHDSRREPDTPPNDFRGLPRRSIGLGRARPDGKSAPRSTGNLQACWQPGRQRSVIFREYLLTICEALPVTYQDQFSHRA